MLRTLLCVALAAVGFAAHAQSRPVKPVTFLNPFPAGGGKWAELKSEAPASAEVDAMIESEFDAEPAT